MSTIRREDERSFRLRPFAHRETLGTDVHRNSPFVSYTYPADYGDKMNSVGFIGDRSMAGKRDVQYGTVPDNMPLHRLTDSDIQILMRWMPHGWNLPKIRGILLVEFHRTATDLPALTWQDITAMLNTRSPAPAANDAPVVKPDRVALDVTARKGAGRLSKADSDAKRTSMLATIREHPTLKDDRSELARIVGVSQSTIWRWLNEEEETYRASKPANVGD